MNNNLVMDNNEDIIKKIENYIKCPRCKQNLKCYRRKILSLDKKECKNVCDHCLNEYILFHKSSKTREIDKKASGRGSTLVKYNRDKVKLWLSRIIDLLENNLILYKTANLAKYAGKVASFPTESRFKTSKKNLHVPELDQMFDSVKLLTETKERAERKIKLVKHGIRYLGDDKHRGQCQDVSKTKAEKVLGEDASLYTFDDDITMSSTDSRQRFSLQDKLQILKKNTFEDSTELSYIKHRTAKYPRTNTAKRPPLDNYEKIYSKSLRDLSGQYFESRAHDINSKSSYLSFKKFNSVESFKASTSAVTEKTFEQNFSYFFPKEEGSKLPIRRHKSSSEIIKETIDMLNERAEMERKKREEERKKKLEEDEKKRLVRIENLKKKSEPQRQTLELIEVEAVTIKKEVTIAKEDKDEKESIHSKSIKSDKTKRKVIKEEKKPTKSHEKPSTEDLKKKRENQSEGEKESKIKEKEERIRLEKENKLKEKAEKEERLRIEREKKLKEKEEKERIKKEKMDQLQKEKEDRRKQMEQQETKSKPKEGPTKNNKGEDKKSAEKDKGDSGKRMQELTEKKLKEEAFLKMIAADSHVAGEEKEKTKPKKEEQSTFKELNISQVKLKKPSQDNLILQLVKLKQEERKEDRIRPKRLSQINVSPLVLKAHQEHKLMRGVRCVLCDDSELELDVDNIIFSEKKGKERTDAIMGQKIVKVYKSPRKEDTKKVNIFEPMLFKSTFIEEVSSPKKTESVSKDESKRSPLPVKRVEPEASKGIIRYALSDRSFIEKGWTMLPTEKVVRKMSIIFKNDLHSKHARKCVFLRIIVAEPKSHKMNIYRMRPAHPEFDWFEHNKNKKLILYDTGEKLAEFDDDGRGRWFYKNGRIALDYYDAEEINAQQRFVIYSNGEPDERGRARPFTILGTFDYLGNGVVFDHSGKIRLKYNQTEGVVLDKSIGPVSHWKWHTLNDPPVLQQVMIDTQMAHKDPDILKLGGHGDDKPRQDNEEMLAIEFDNFIKEKSKKLTQKFKPFQIKMKALKINENFSLKVLDQATVYLIFRDGSTNLKLNIGMILDHKEIVDTDTAEVGEVSNSLERFPAKTDSLAGLQQSVAHAQRVERARVERQRRLRPSQSWASADKLTMAASRPLRQPFRTEASNVSTSRRDCYCKFRKPSTCNIYYDTRLV